jgi:hypothetical protein
MEAGLIVTGIVGVDDTVAHGLLVARTSTFCTVAEPVRLLKVTLKAVLVLLTDKVFQVAPLSDEYSYTAPAIYGVQVAENDTVLPEQIVVVVVATRIGAAVKSALTNTLTGLE